MFVRAWRKHPYAFSLLFLLLFAFIVRVIALIYAAQLPFWTHYRLDAALYHQQALRIINGDWLLGHHPYQMSPFYTYFVALLYFIFPRTPCLVPCVQMLLGLGIVFFLFDLGYRLFRDLRLAWATGFLAACYGTFIFYEAHLLATTTATFFNTALLWLTVVALQKEELSKKLWFLVGIVWGLAVLTRPNALILALPLFLLPLLAFSQQGWRRLIPSLFIFLGLFTTIAPVTLRNLIVAKEFVLVTNSGGLNFYLGNGPHANGSFRIPPEMPQATNAEAQFAVFRHYAQKITGTPLTPKEVDRFWYRRTFRHIFQHPADWLALLWKKWLLLWNAQELANSHDYTFASKINPFYRFPWISFGWLAPFALLGTLLLLFSQLPQERWIGAFNLMFSLALVLFFILAHYRVTILGGFIIAAIFALRWLWKTFQVHHWKAFIAALSLLFITFFFSQRPMLYKGFQDEYYKLAYAYHVQQKFGKAEHYYLEALKLDPLHLSSLKNLALLYEWKKNPQKARKIWLKLIIAAQKKGAYSYFLLAQKHLSLLQEHKTSIKK